MSREEARAGHPRWAHLRTPSPAKDKRAALLVGASARLTRPLFRLAQSAACPPPVEGFPPGTSEPGDRGA